MDGVRDEPAIPDDVQDEALAWVARLTSGEADEADRAAFADWRDRSPLHARALAEARDLWTLLGPALVAGQERRATEAFAADAVAGGPAAGPPIPATAPVPAARRTEPYRVSRRLLATAAAAVLVFAVGLSVLTPRADFTTGAETATRMLADGSRVTLAPGAALDVEFSGDGSRRATLRRGEVLFDVAPDPSRPFIVHSGAGQVRVLGTVFGVRKSGGITGVTVEAGRVEVRSGDEVRVLEADRAVTYGLDSMGGVRAVDAGAALGWTKGWLYFENWTVADVIAELDRHRTEKIVLVNRTAGRRRINGAVNLSEADRWLAALEASQDVTVTRLPGVIVIR